VSRERIEADYLIETAFRPEAAAESMAGEQSSGTFVPIPGETPELKARAAARVERLDVVGEATGPSLAWRRRAKSRVPALASGARHPVVAPWQSWAFIAQPDGDRGGQSL
jgi:hypothetical protein